MLRAELDDLCAQPQYREHGSNSKLFGDLISYQNGGRLRGDR